VLARVPDSGPCCCALAGSAIAGFSPSCRARPRSLKPHNLPAAAPLQCITGSGRPPAPVHRRRQRGGLHHPGLPGLQVRRPGCASSRLKALLAREFCMSSVRGQACRQGRRDAGGVFCCRCGRAARRSGQLAIACRCVPAAGTCLPRAPATTGWPTPSCWQGTRTSLSRATSTA
jgi:hypothetical protein